MGITCEHRKNKTIIVVFSEGAVVCIIITKTSLFKYTEYFTTKKMKISDKNSDIFHISAQNLDCWYLLEPPQRGGSNEYPQSMFLAEERIIITPPPPPHTHTHTVNTKKSGV